MSVNQGNNALVKRKRQIAETPKKNGCLDKKVRPL